MSDEKLNFEIKRKTFHLFAIIFPIFYVFTPKVTMLVMLVVISSITIYIDVYRHYNANIKELVDKFFKNFMRESEKTRESKLSGSSYMALGFLISCLLFEKNLVITSWLILIISDSLAAIVGMKIGTQLINKKSYEGSFAFLISAILISIMSHFIIGYKTSFVVIVISSFFASLGEFYTKQIKIDDNILIPITYCMSTVVFRYIIY